LNKEEEMSIINESSSEDYYNSDGTNIEDSSEETKLIKLLEIESKLINIF
jgi:hypothetical protein